MQQKLQHEMHTSDNTTHRTSTEREKKDNTHGASYLVRVAKTERTPRASLSRTLQPFFVVSTQSIYVP